MASYRSLASNNGTANPMTGNKPSGVVDGDLLLAFVFHNASAATITAAPSGWTLVNDDPNPGINEDFSSWCYRKVASSEPASWDWTASTSANWRVIVVAIQDPNGTTPVNANAVEAAGTVVTTNNVAIGPITTTVDGCLVVSVGSTDATGGARTWTADGSPTERLDSLEQTFHCAVYTETQATQGSITRDLTVTGSAQYLIGHIVAVAPVSATVLTPSPVAVPILLPAPTVTAARTLAPTALAIPLAFPSLAVTAVRTVTPSAVAVPLSLPAPTVSASRTVTPAALTVPITIPSPTVSGAGALTPSAVAVLIVLPAPVILATRTLTPDALAIPLAIPSPTVGNLLTPDAVAVPISLPAPSVIATRTATPSPLAIPIALPAPTLVTSGATVLTPSAVAIIISLPGPTVIGGTSAPSAPVSPDLLSAALLAILRADAALVSALPEGQGGIREESWKGTRFQYPNVRVARPELTPWGNGNCSPHQSINRIRILAFSRKDSSINAQKLQGLIATALEGARLDTAEFATLPLRANRRGAVRPENVFDMGEYWMGQVHFRTVVFPK